MPEKHKAFAVQVVDTTEDNQIEYQEFDDKKDAEALFKKMVDQYDESLPNGERTHTVQLFSGSKIVKDNAGDQGAIRTFEEQAMAKKVDESSRRWQSVSQVYSKLNDTQMDYLQGAVLVGENDRKIWEMAKKNPKQAAKMAIQEYKKWLMQDMNDDLKIMEPFLVKELALSVKEESVTPGEVNPLIEQVLEGADPRDVVEGLNEVRPTDQELRRIRLGDDSRLVVEGHNQRSLPLYRELRELFNMSKIINDYLETRSDAFGMVVGYKEHRKLHKLLLSKVKEVHSGLDPLYLAVAYIVRNEFDKALDALR